MEQYGHVTMIIANDCPNFITLDGMKNYAWWASLDWTIQFNVFVLIHMQMGIK